MSALAAEATGEMKVMPARSAALYYVAALAVTSTGGGVATKVAYNILAPEPLQVALYSYCHDRDQTDIEYLTEALKDQLSPENRADIAVSERAIRERTDVALIDFDEAIEQARAMHNSDEVVSYVDQTLRQALGISLIAEGTPLENAYDSLAVMEMLQHEPATLGTGAMGSVAVASDKPMHLKTGPAGGYYQASSDAVVLVPANVRDGLWHEAGHSFNHKRLLQLTTIPGLECIDRQWRATNPPGFAYGPNKTDAEWMGVTSGWYAASEYKEDVASQISQIAKGQLECVYLTDTESTMSKKTVLAAADIGAVSGDMATAEYLVRRAASLCNQRKETNFTGS